MQEKGCGQVSWPACQLSHPWDFALAALSHNGTVALPYTFPLSIFCVTNFLYITYSLLFSLSQHDSNILLVQCAHHMFHHTLTFPRLSR